MEAGEGHQNLYNSPVMLVVMASLLLMNCRLHVVYVQLISVRLLVKSKICLAVVFFDRPCSKFVVMLLFRLYSCTFVNVDAVNGMSFTLFEGRKKKEAKIVHLDMCVYIHHSFLLEYNVYSFI